MRHFGSIFRDSRIGIERTLLDASRALEIDLDLLSKIERGIDPAPSDQRVVTKWAYWLGIDDPTRAEFFAAAVASVQAGPAELPTEADIDQCMPAFLPRLTDKDISALRIRVRESLTPTACLNG